MYRVLKIISLAILFLIIQQTIFAQDDPPMVWGQVPSVDLKMTSYPQDSNATAVILCDYGQSFFNNDLNVEMDREVRIKILSKDGYKWGTFAIQLRNVKPIDQIRDVEGVTYSLDANGNVVKTELNSDDVYQDKVSDEMNECRFTMPNLKPGCVIEVRYKIISDGTLLMPSWTFQCAEPTVWSEYRVTFPTNIIYASVYGGYEPWFFHETKKVQRTFQYDAADVYGNDPVDCYQYRYVVKDAPAIRNEPFMTTTSDYVNKVDVQLNEYQFPLSPLKKVLRDWKSVVSDFLDDDDFGGRIDVTSDVKQTADEITKGLTDPNAKMRAIYNWVSHSIVETDAYFTPKKDVDDIIETREGNNTEVSFLLVSLLKSVGIDAYTVMTSTRDNGMVHKVYPMISQFNYTLVMANIDSTEYYLDPANPFRSYDLLPEKILGSDGLIMKKGPILWTKFSAPKPEVNTTLAVLNLSKDGSIKGFVQQSLGEYKSLSLREELNGKTNIELAKELFNSASENISIDSAQVSNKDSLELPLKVTEWISSSNYTQDYGNMIYINPFVVNQLKENPFKTKIRHFPVDYGYPRQTTSVIDISLPEGYELKDVPQNIVYKINNNIQFSMLTQTDGRKVQMFSRFLIGQSIVDPADYDKLKQFYSLVVSAQAEQLVIEPKGNNQKSQTHVSQNSAAK
jgi:transglutaminase-like putative cysteine protease